MRALVGLAVAVALTALLGGCWPDQSPAAAGGKTEKEAHGFDDPTLEGGGVLASEDTGV